MKENKRALSVTQLNMFLRCPKQYEYRYMEGLIVPPSGALIQGSAYHETLANALMERQQGNMITEERIEDFFNTSFNTQVNKRTVTKDGEIFDADSIDWGDDEPGKMKDEGITLAKLYCDFYLNTIKPISIEEKGKVEIEDIPFLFIADVVEEHRIIDHKLKKRRSSEGDLANDLQATAYSMILQKPVEFHEALKTKKPEIVIAPTSREQRDFDFFTKLLVSVSNSITTGLFFPNPTGWNCSEQWCGYWKMCRGK